MEHALPPPGTRPLRPPQSAPSDGGADPPRPRPLPLDRAFGLPGAAGSSGASGGCRRSPPRAGPAPPFRPMRRFWAPGNSSRSSCARPASRPPARVPLATLTARVAAHLGVALPALFGGTQTRPAVTARQLLAYVWVKGLGRRASALARALGQTHETVSTAARRGAVRAAR